MNYMERMHSKEEKRLKTDLNRTKSILRHREKISAKWKVLKTKDKWYCVRSSVSHFIAAPQGPNFRHFFPGHPMLCAVILSCIYFPWYIREKKEQKRATIHPSWLSPHWPCLETAAEARKMTTGILKKSEVNDGDESTVASNVLPTYRVPRKTTRHKEEPHWCGSGPFKEHPFSPSSSTCGAAMKPQISQKSWSKCHLIFKKGT